jgi:hypothetical protein
MKADDIPRFQTALESCIETLGGKTPTERALKVWYATLRDFSLHDTELALADWIRFKSRAPTPSDICNALAAIRDDRQQKMAAATTKVTMAEEAAFVRSPAGREVLQKLSKALPTQAKPARVNRDWATKIIDRYVDGDTELTAASVRTAAEALGYSRDDLAAIKPKGDRP